LDSAQRSEVILAHGHINVLALHKGTIEFTKEPHLSRSGDCIIAVDADKGMSELSLEFKKNLRNDAAKVTIVVEAGKVSETIHASGNSRLILAHPTDIVIRKSGYICARTLAIHADKSAAELSRELVRNLSKPEEKVQITLAVKSQ
jgi:hypothetical protein